MLPPLSQPNQPGLDGQNAYVYIASASSSGGANFTYPASLDNPGTLNGKFWISIIQSTTPLTPVAADFTVWERVVGADGTNGTNGTNGTDGVFGGVMFEYVFFNYGLTGNPGSGKISFNNTADLTSNINISETDANGTSLINILDLFYASTNTTKALVKVVSKTDSTKFAAYRVVAGSDGGTFRTLLTMSPVYSSTTPFTAGEEVLVTVAIAGDKGDAGIPGPAGAFIIGNLSPALCVGPSTTCFAASKIFYPVPSSGGTITQGSAYRFISNGYITDGTTDVRVFTNDVLYCTADITSTIPSAANWFIWVGYKRGFKAGSGPDSYVQNAAGSGDASGSNSIAFNKDNSVAGDNSAAFGTAVQVPGDKSLGVGDNISLDGTNNLAHGTGITTNSAVTNSLLSGNTHDASAVTIPGGETNVNVAVFGSGHTLGAYPHKSVIKGIDAVNQYPASETFGGGKFVTAGDNQRIDIQLSTLTTAVDATNDLDTTFGFYSLYNSALKMPVKSIWKVKGQVIGYNTVDDKMMVWDFHFVAKCQLVLGVPVARIVTDIYFLPPSGVPSSQALGLVPNPARNQAVLTDGDALYEEYGVASGTVTIYDVVAGSDILHLEVSSAAIANKTMRWNGKLEIIQLGWF